MPKIVISSENFPELFHPHLFNVSFKVLSVFLPLRDEIKMTSPSDSHESFFLETATTITLFIYHSCFPDFLLQLIL